MAQDYLTNLIAAYRNQPTSSRKAVVGELRAIHGLWFDTVSSKETADDVNTLRIVCQILDHLDPKDRAEGRDLCNE